MMLDLGAGSRRDNGYTTVDIAGNPDVLHDLNRFPYPFKKESVSFIRINHCLEHLKNPLRVVQECRRILKPNGFLEIRVPHYSHVYAFEHPGHINYFALNTCNYFGGFRVVDKRLHYVSDRHRTWPMLRQIPFDLLALLFPRFSERVLAGWIGGYQEIYWMLRKEVVSYSP